MNRTIKILLLIILAYAVILCALTFGGGVERLRKLAPGGESRGVNS
jgi:hypothetical protein